jgi:hypothetical protein
MPRGEDSIWQLGGDESFAVWWVDREAVCEAADTDSLRSRRMRPRQGRAVAREGVALARPSPRFAPLDRGAVREGVGGGANATKKKGGEFCDAPP